MGRTPGPAEESAGPPSWEIEMSDPPPRRLGVLLALAALATACRVEDDSGPVDGGGSFWIHLELASLEPERVTLALTASSTFLDTPLWRNGMLVGRVDLSPTATVVFSDGDVVRGATYTYLAGGFFLLGGEIWSEPVTVVVP